LKLYVPNGKRFRRAELAAATYYAIIHHFCGGESEGSETGGVIFDRQLSRGLQAHVGHFRQNNIIL
jgi:hypothetical protein